MLLALLTLTHVVGVPFTNEKNSKYNCPCNAKKSGQGFHNHYSQLNAKHVREEIKI